MMIIKKYLENLYTSAVKLNHKNIYLLFEKNEKANFLDLGCDDGTLTIEIANIIGTKNIYSIEITDDGIALSGEKGIQTKQFDLNSTFDFENNSFDVINANQIIEHIYKSDNFLQEIYRVLKPGGYAVISTENASSWCNIFSALLGWQIFSLTNFSSKKQGIGNPLALHRGNNSIKRLDSWNHIRIYNIRGLKEYFDIFNFKVEKIEGAGYFPFPAFFGKIDKVHCHFMTFKIRKIDK